MKILKKKITRISALLTACILTGISAFIAAGALETHSAFFDYDNHCSIYGDPVLGNLSLRNNVNELFDDLWLIGSIYLRNTDSNGKYTCSKEKQKSIIGTLSERGLMTENGRIIINDDNSYDYCLSYGSRKISNTDIPENELSKSDYYYIYNGGITQKMGLHHFDHDNIMYTTNYGVERYVIGGYDEIIIYDYDTEGLDCYHDENGTRFYYKTDGSTPMPAYLDYDEFDENSDIYEDERERVYFIYDRDNNIWVPGDYSPFTSTIENDNKIKITIKPRDEVITEIKRNINEYNTAKESLFTSVICILPLAAAVLFITLFVLIADGWDETENKYAIKRYDKIWAEIPLAMAVGFAFLAVFHFLPDVIQELNDLIGHNVIKFIYAFSVPVLYAGIIFMCCSLLRRLKCGCFCKSTFVYKFISVIFKLIKKLFLKIRNYWRKNIAAKQLIKNDILTRRFLFRTGICIVAESVSLFICLFLDLFLDLAPLFVILSIQILAAFIILSLRDLNSIKKLSEQIENISGGDYTPVSVPETSVTYNMTNMLNNISDGIQKSVEKRVSAERMKIDLVTNVSHDLKTPLTSIISYIDLLAAEELPPAAADYVKILEQKSDRLKSIVSDLFELAKATSNTDIKSEEIDAVILIGQVLADMSDKIQKYGREIRTDISAETAPIFAEGKKLYRVFQNLIDNALKYSIEGTRIYLSLHTNQNEVTVEIKNISAYEMKFTADEITERFVRGDESRTSEGNGLGLSIAKSFSEACGGKLAVSIDGDVFSVKVCFPLILC